MIVIPYSLGEYMIKEVAIKAVDDALLLNGYVEKSDNWDKNIQEYLKCVFIDFQAPYCIAFVKYRIIQAAKDFKFTLSEEFMKLDGWCPNWGLYGKKHKVWIPMSESRVNSSLIKKGYIALFYSDAKERLYHAGLVISSTKEGVWTIEANTADTTGLNPDGDGIFKKFRRWNTLGKNGGFLKTY
jgi:hypothetical protein